MGLAQDPGADEGAPDGGEGPAAEPEAGGRVFALSGDAVPPPPAEEPPRRSAIREWLLGKATNASSLLAFVIGGGLLPLEKALTLKILRRALEARAEVEGSASLDDVSLAGDEAVLMLAEAVMCAALVAALAPARVSASPVALDVEPAPWTEAVLLGGRLAEGEWGFAPTTPLGAAVVRALAYRFGPRGEVTVLRAGTGLGPSGRRGKPHVTRALYGRDLAIATREEGTGAAAGTRVEAVLAAVERPSLVEALTRLGAASLTTEAVLDAEGSACTRVVCVVPAPQADGVVRTLFAFGARDVHLSTLERRRPEAREVTVFVGRGNRKELVRLTELVDQGEVLSVAPSQRDLEEAAARLGTTKGALEREALLAYARARDGAGEP